MRQEGKAAAVRRMEGHPALDSRRDDAEEIVLPTGSEAGLQPDRTLHPLAQTAEAGDEYIQSLTLLCDSSFAGLRSTALTRDCVWSSETGYLPMDSIESWKIRYPGDGSQISPQSAVLIAKPKYLILAIGADNTADMQKDAFIDAYAALIRGLAKASPEAKIVCLTLCSVTASYVGDDGMSGEKAQEINGWIRDLCIETGAFYGDLTPVLCVDGNLRADYADGSGRALNTAGLRELIGYLRSHSLDAQ